MNPALMGPQAFPSSSVMRFGPSILVLLLVAKVCVQKKTDLINLTSFIISIAFLWSFESFFYSMMTLLGVIVGSRDAAPVVEHTNATIRKLVLRTLLMTLSFAFAYSAYVLLTVGGLPSWSWFWLAATKYAGGFGALPTDLSGSALMAILGIIITALGSFYIPHPVKRVFTASAFTLTAWFSYYVGRSHSANLLALLPGIFLAVSLPLVYCNWYSGSTSRAGSRVIRASHIGLCVSIVTIFASGLVINPSVPSLLANYRPLPFSAQFEEGAAFPQELALLFGDIDHTSRLPLAYQGNFGVLPDPPIEVKGRIDETTVWLPKPLALLEFPFPESLRQVVLKRRAERFSPRGYFVWHKSERVPGHGELWKKALQPYFSCQVIAGSSNWEISKCKPLKH